MEIDFAIPDCPFKQYFTTDFVSSDVLTISEKELAKNFSEKRLRHFSTGRYCAKMALKNLTQDSFEILKGIDGEPIWPQNFAGSISHSNGLVGAVVSNNPLVTSIGIDIEETGRVKPEMWDLLFTDNEKEFLNSLNAEEKIFFSTLYFSMKESFYKFQFSITNHKLWFHDVEIHKAYDGFKMIVLKEFNGKEKLPLITNMYFAKKENYIISICFDEKHSN